VFEINELVLLKVLDNTRIDVVILLCDSNWEIQKVIVITQK